MNAKFKYFDGIFFTQDKEYLYFYVTFGIKNEHRTAFTGHYFITNRKKTFSTADNTAKTQGGSKRSAPRASSHSSKRN